MTYFHPRDFDPGSTDDRFIAIENGSLCRT